MTASAFPPALLDHLRRSRDVVVLTGAGISAESGIPTFRDAQTGLWSQYNPTELASPEGFRRNPELVWKWYAWRRQLVSQAQPNPGHFALAELERKVPRFTLVTQNIDGLHQQAGSRHVIELHGNIHRTKCFEEDVLVSRWEETGQLPPRCPNCRSYLRPDVVWFGESLPAAGLEASLLASRSCDLFFSIGTSGLVYPAAWLPHEALASRALVVEINPIPTPLTTTVHYALTGPAGLILPALLRQTWP